MAERSENVDEDGVGVDGVLFDLFALLRRWDSFEPIFDVRVFDEFVDDCFPNPETERRCFFVVVRINGFYVRHCESP